MKIAKKKCAPTPLYVSPAQLSLECFKTPFEQHLNFKNRWVVFGKSYSMGRSLQSLPQTCWG